MGRQVEITDGRADESRPAPLIIVLHGVLGSGKNMRRKTGFDALARRDGTVVAYPNGIARRWNDGRIAGQRVDDVAHISALIAALITDGRADPGRVFLAGHSNGGGMAMRMACARPDLIRGIAVVATKAALDFQCDKGRPMPALFIHGTSDPISPHAGRRGDSRLGGALSSAATLALWQKRNRCSGTPRSQTRDTVDDGTTLRIVQYAGCAAPLIYAEIIGHGHAWPDPRSRGTPLQGPATKEVDGAALSWWFFKDLK